MVCTFPFHGYLLHMKKDLYLKETNDIRITVRPQFLHSEPAHDGDEYVFAYKIQIKNLGKDPAQLLWRQWYIHDSIGEESEVEGEGVVGEQPVIEPGRTHEYQSFCILRSPRGYMEGAYQFAREDGSRFTAFIPRFFLDTVSEEPGDEYLH